jgi:D-alanine transfer protein
MPVLNEMKPPSTLHLWSAFFAFCVIAVLLGGLDWYTASAAGAALPRLEAISLQSIVKAKDASVAFQRAAAAQSNTVLLYGSSELNARTRYRAGVFFSDAPTGFYVLSVGRPGTTSLIILQKLASLGTALQGKKVALSISQPWMNEQIPRASYYDGNFYIQNASALIFQPALSLDLKRAAAERMLYYENTLERDPVALLGAQLLVSNTPGHNALYYALLPLGMLDNLVYRFQDDAETLQLIQRLPTVRERVRPEKGPIDWEREAAKAAEQFRAESASNPYGMSDKQWQKLYANYLTDPHLRWIDKTFKQRMLGALEWEDLELTLRALQELGAKPLLLSMPLPRQYWQDLGVSPSVQDLYYQRLASLAQKYNVPLRDFHEHADDLEFMNDPMAHLSPKGWVYYDQALDAFYHDALQ